MKGRAFPLPPGRRFIADLSWLANRVPQGVVWRDIDIAAVRKARAAAADPVPWTVIFARAWALAAQDCAPLRRTFATLPWPHLYETEGSVAAIIIERDWNGEPSLFSAKIKQPETKTLADIAAELKLALTAPVGSHKPFRSMLRANRLPQFLRRLLWLIAFNTGPLRAKFFGTFGLTVLGQRGVTVNYPVSPVTTVLTLGPFRPDGKVEAVIGFDHRTMDGAAIADALDALQRHLDGTVAAELASMA